MLKRVLDTDFRVPTNVQYTGGNSGKQARTLGHSNARGYWVTLDKQGQPCTLHPLAQGGKVKALGLTSLKRATAAPEIPTVAESGVTGFAFVSWYGLWGPKNLPAEISDKLQAEIAKLLALPDAKARLNALGFDPIGTGGGRVRALHSRGDG